MNTDEERMMKLTTSLFCSDTLELTWWDIIRLMCGRTLKEHAEPAETKEER